MLDPDIAAFAADQDAIFDQAFSARPIREQRALYEEFWRRYHAPRLRPVWTGSLWKCMRVPQKRFRMARMLCGWIYWMDC